MRRENVFYSLFALTIAAVRLEVLSFPLHKIIINGSVVHHFWIGLFLLAVFFVLPRKYGWLKIVLLAASLGLVADELAYILFGNGTVTDYWSTFSMAGMLVSVAFVFAIRKQLTKNAL
jgi:hypothetical protein